MFLVNRFTFIGLLVMISNFSMAQDSIPKRYTGAFELGLCFGQAGPSGGNGGNFGMRIMINKWGGTFHNMGFSGLTANRSYFLFGPPKEWFKETAIMGSRQLWSSRRFRAIASTGWSFIGGRQLDDTKTDFETMDQIDGLAWELAFGTVGSTAGLMVSFTGNINRKRPLAACTVAVTLGKQK